MSRFDEVTRLFGDVRYMDAERARFLRSLIIEQGVRDVLEIGFYQGKSSAYLAAILEDIGAGHLTTIDRVGSRDRVPNIQHLLEALRLTHRVSPIYAERSYTWELGRLIREGRQASYDFCYFDGGHTWDATGFGFHLVDMLLRPGGSIIFDDLDWTIEASVRIRPARATRYRTYSQDERRTPGVRTVFETLVPYLGYGSRSEEKRFDWGIARKPLAR